jgi:SAM-dependent methyltransferase
LTGEDPSYFPEYKIKLFSAWAGSTARNIIDFGAGIGNSISYFRKHFAAAAITCSDISQISLEYASRRYPGPEQKLKISRECIPAANDFYDAAFSACVFHHIPHSEHEFWLRELLRVVRPGGTIAVFEHNPFNPLTQRAVNICPFDENAVLVRPRRIEAALHCARLGPTVIRIYVVCGVQLFSLGVIGEYIGKIYLETKGRPRFFISEKIAPASSRVEGARLRHDVGVPRIDCLDRSLAAHCASKRLLRYPA